MNNLIIFESEIEGSQAVVSGPRASELIRRHELKEGIKIRAAQYNGKRGSAQVIAISECRVELLVNFTLPPMERLPVELIVGVCRPQTVKKVIELATVTGVERLNFLKVAGSEKSYFQSKVLQPEELRRRVIEGLEQSCDSIGPIIEVHSKFKPFMEDILPGRIKGASCLIADTISSERAEVKSSVGISCSGKIILAVGPESGWNDFERSMFSNLNFQTVSLGERMYRTETATAMLLGQIQAAISK